MILSKFQSLDDIHLQRLAALPAKNKIFTILTIIFGHKLKSNSTKSYKCKVCQLSQKILPLTLIKPEVTQYFAVNNEGAKPILYINIGNLNSKVFKNKKIAQDFLAIQKLQKFLNLCFFKFP